MPRVGKKHEASNKPTHVLTLPTAWISNPARGEDPAQLPQAPPEVEAYMSEGDEGRADSGRRASTSSLSSLSDDEGEGVNQGCLEGPGALILLPDGRLSGSLFVDSPSGSRRQYGVHGRTVADFRDCTRDDEWDLMLVTVTDFVGGGSEVRVLCERTEEDAARLRPFTPQGEEARELKTLVRSCSRKTRLSFDCDVIVTGPGADQLVATLAPRLRGRELVVNRGTFRIVNYEGTRDHGDTALREGRLEPGYAEGEGPAEADEEGDEGEEEGDPEGGDGHNPFEDLSPEEILRQQSQKGRVVELSSDDDWLSSDEE